MSAVPTASTPNTAFIGLDYIVDIMHPQGKIAHSAPHAAERKVIEKANRALAFAHEKRWLSILVKVGFNKGYAEQPKHSPLFGRAHEGGALELGAPGTEFHPELEAQLADLVIVKPRVSAFYCTQLDAALRARKIERVVVAGVSSSWAVQSTVRDAHDRDYDVIVLEDACAAVNEAEHQTSMALLARIAKIITTDDLPNL
jgi:nicotinamidase-related amidase